MTPRGEVMRVLRLPVIPLVILAIAGVAVGPRADAQPAARLVVFEDFLRPG
jgi:hypothetical protein